MPSSPKQKIAWTRRSFLTRGALLSGGLAGVWFGLQSEFGERTLAALLQYPEEALLLSFDRDRTRPGHQVCLRGRWIAKEAAPKALPIALLPGLEGKAADPRQDPIEGLLLSFNGRDGEVSFSAPLPPQFRGDAEVVFSLTAAILHPDFSSAQALSAPLDVIASPFVFGS